MAYRTLTYSETSQGFPSFYSYQPESILGMNNYLYTFNGGNLYRHNTNPLYNNYYGVQYASTITSVFNDSPLQPKLFKTLELHADDAWTAFGISGDAPLTGKQVAGDINDSLMEQKEGSWFGYIRNQTTSANNDIPDNQYGQRSIKGIGVPTALNNPNTNACTITFNSLSSTVCIGAFVYQDKNNIGQISAIDSDTNTITINNDTTAFPTLTVADVTKFTYYVQSVSVESHGVIGNYLEFNLLLSTTSASELFAVKADIMKSYP